MQSLAWDPNTPKVRTQKGSNERLFILTRTHSVHIFGEIPFIKPLKQQITGQKRWKMKEKDLFCLGSKKVKKQTNKKTLFIRTKQNTPIFGVILFIKLQNDALNKGWTVKNDEKWDGELTPLICFGLSYVVIFGSSAWKNVPMFPVNTDVLWKVFMSLDLVLER